MTFEDCLPCRCHQRPRVGVMTDGDDGYFYVECPGSWDGHFAGAHCDTEEKAVLAWNNLVGNPRQAVESAATEEFRE